jgi:uncharacterized protein (TIGR01777 family)
MRVLITGATGTIGLAVADALRARGDQVVALSRDPERGQRVLSDGEPIAQRWSDDAKQRIHDSRIKSTQQLVQGLTSLPDGERPGVLVSQSAVGYYGSRGDEPLDEQSSPGHDFLAEIVVEWERAAAAPGGMRVALTRTGVVLSPSGGALAKMLPFFKLGVGGPVAGGKQYVPWIHLDDVVGGLIRCLDDGAASGPVNLTAPRPVTNAELSRALGHVLGRPAILPVPGLAVKLLYGEMAEIVTGGQRALPARLSELGYGFRHPEIESALADVLS